MKKLSLPPLIENIRDGKVAWKRIEGVDFEFLGYFLSCHLIIEYYLDQYLRTKYPELGWEGSRLTFAQKISLLSTEYLPEKYNSIPAIKHMNSLRNKLSHNIEFNIAGKDLVPIVQYLKKSCSDMPAFPTEPKELLDLFTMMVCVWFASGISSTAQQGRVMRT